MSYTAEGFRSYREIRKLLGRPVPSGGPRVKPERKPRARTNPLGKRQNDFHKKVFCAWDGEGIGHPRNRYIALQNSDGACLRGKNLRSKTIFEFLLNHRGSRHTVHCVYGGVYDFTHWILDVPDVLKQELHETGHAVWGKYHLTFTPRKSFRLEDRSAWEPRMKGERASAWHKRNRKHTREIQVWDVIGFFQSSFLSALYKWGIGTKEEQAWIARMKLGRDTFAQEQTKEILDYNALECRLLKALMEKLHSLLATNPLDEGSDENNVWLPLRRWDGAGAVAAAMYRREGMKLHIGSSVETDGFGHVRGDWHYRTKQEQSDIEYALRCAYFGGRIECFQRGRAHRAGYDIDIVSAYPAAMLSLPTFRAGGRWKETDTFDREAFGVWETEWDCVDLKTHTIFPLPYRTHRGGVLFPDRGKGWYHTVEVAEAMRDARNRVRVLRGYVWKPATDEKPFAFVQRYFQARRKLQASGNAAEKILKLGLNSLYGKMAQTLGSTLEEFPSDERGVNQCRTESYVEDCGLDKIFLRVPPFFNLAWAGAVTAHCRATVYREAMKRESEILMIQTDGLFGVGEAPEYPKTGELGSFDVVPYADAILVQAGVYYLADSNEDGTLCWGVARTRGFYADEVDLEEVLQAWEAGEVLELEYQSRPRFQTLGYSVSKRSFEGLACWQSQPRNLHLYADSKRTSIPGFTTDLKEVPKKDLQKLRLHKRLRPAYALLNTDFLAGCPSRPSDPKWRQKLHESGDDDFALSEPLIEGSDFLDHVLPELIEKFGF